MLDDLTQRYDRMTARQAFYQLEVAGVVAKTETGYRQVQKQLLVMRREGLLDWSFITDGTRWQRKPESWRSIDDFVESIHRGYRRDLWHSQGKRIEVWLEKDGLADVVVDVTAAWDVPLMVSRGQSSVTFLHSAAKAAERAYDATGADTYVYALYDFDAGGQRAADAVERELPAHAPGVPIHFERLAVTSQQISQWSLPSRPPKKKDPQAAKWGSTPAVELDAIPPVQLLALVENAIKGHVDMRRWEAEKRVEEEERGEITYDRVMAAELRDAGPALHVEELGEGEPALLLLTGWCSSHERWALAAPLLAANRRVVLFDWRGHGDSPAAQSDFGTAQLVDDAMAVIEDRDLQTVIPCSASHSGWVAIELRRRLGERVPAIVHLDWMVNRPSAPYMELISALQSEQTWPQARDKLFEIWAADDHSPAIAGALEVMRRQGAEMWIRSGREIEAEYARDHSPLEAYAALPEPPRVLHIYGQPPAEEYLAAQRRFAEEYDWFEVVKLDAHTHFSMIERAEEVAAAIEQLAATVPAP